MIIDDLKLELLREEMKLLLNEFSQSLDIQLVFKLNRKEMDGSKQFQLQAEGELTTAGNGSATLNSDSPYQKYEQNWRWNYRTRGLDYDLLGKVIEAEDHRSGLKKKYRIVGLSSKYPKKGKNCVACVTLSTGKLAVATVDFIKRAKVISND